MTGTSNLFIKNLNMAFKAVRYDSGKVVELKAASALTGVKWDGLADDGTGYWELADSSDTVVRYVLLDAVTSATEGDTIRVLPTRGVQFECDCTGTPTQTSVGTTCDLTDENILNEDASSVDVFQIEEIVGPASDKKVRGYFRTGIAT